MAAKRSHADVEAAEIIADSPADAHFTSTDVPVPPPSRKEPPHHLAENRRPAQSHVPDGIIQSYVSNFKGPTPNHENVFVLQEPATIDTIAEVTYRQILNVLYPDGDYMRPNMITMNQFSLICRYVLKSRIDHVYSTLSGRRPTDRVPLVRIPIPKSIADLINCVGSVLIHSGSVLVIPQPPRAPDDNNKRLISIVTHELLVAFSSFVTLAAQRGVIRLSSVSAIPQGTAMWILRACETTNRNVVATAVTTNITVISQFSEWTPLDGILCALFVNGFNGHALADVNDFFFSMDSIVDAIGFRTSFSTLA